MGSGEECFILVLVIVITKKTRWNSRFHHDWLMVGGERGRKSSHNGRAEWIIKTKFIEEIIE